MGESSRWCEEALQIKGLWGAVVLVLSRKEKRKMDFAGESWRTLVVDGVVCTALYYASLRPGRGLRPGFSLADGGVLFPARVGLGILSFC